MKVLWISLRLFENSDEKQTAVWLKALAIKLSMIPNIHLANVSNSSSVNEIQRCDFGSIQQWALPNFSIDQKGLPAQYIQEKYNQILQEFNPDIIQIWGSENPLKLLPFINTHSAAKVLTMQGVLGSIEEKSLIGLSFSDIISTIGIREVIQGKNIYAIAKSFSKEAFYENEMIRRSDFIITQSNWTQAQIQHLNLNAIFFRVQRELRPEFLNAKQIWSDFTHDKPIIYSAAVGYSLKGLHTLIKSLAIVKIYFPEVELRLAGATGRRDWLGDGYLRFILKLIRKLDLASNVTWLGPVPAKDIVKNLQEASVFVNPSFVESYSMVVAESMAIGTPSVISYAGAMPELAEPNKEALFFPVGDYKNLAFCILRLLRNTDLSLTISHVARQRSIKRIEDTDNAREQYRIYENVLEFHKTPKNL